MIISVCFIAIILILFLFIILIFVGEMNSLLYNIKLDMYSINKSAIISVNKGITSRDSFSYDEKEFKECFEKLIKINYNLDESLKNEEKIIESVKIKEYKILSDGKKDKYTNIRVNDTTIHTVIEVKVKPIIMKDMLEKIFTFEIHEDVVLNEVKI